MKAKLLWEMGREFSLNKQGPCSRLGAQSAQALQRQWESMEMLPQFHSMGYWVRGYMNGKLGLARILFHATKTDVKQKWYLHKTNSFIYNSGNR